MPVSGTPLSLAPSSLADRQASTRPAPSRHLTVGSGLMLHAHWSGHQGWAVAIRHCHLGKHDRSGWTHLPAVKRLSLRHPSGQVTPALIGAASSIRKRRPPSLAYAPAARQMLSLIDRAVLACYATRQEPRGTLAWHFSNEAVHRPGCRLLLRIHVSSDARTTTGHDAAAVRVDLDARRGISCSIGLRADLAVRSR